MQVCSSYAAFVWRHTHTYHCVAVRALLIRKNRLGPLSTSARVSEIDTVSTTWLGTYLWSNDLSMLSFSTIGVHTTPMSKWVPSTSQSRNRTSSFRSKSEYNEKIVVQPWDIDFKAHPSLSNFFETGKIPKNKVKYHKIAQISRGLYNEYTLNRIDPIMRLHIIQSLIHIIRLVSEQFW